MSERTKRVETFSKKELTKTNIKRVDIPEGFERIGVNAFKNMTKLKEVRIAESVREICGHAFEGCTMLSAVSMPSELKLLGDHRLCTDHLGNGQSCAVFPADLAKCQVGHARHRG